MKSIRIFMLQLCIFSILCGCDKDVNSTIPPCDPDVIGQNTKYYFNQTGTLTLIDADPKPAVLRLTQIINSADVAYVPLVPCNLPFDHFDLSIGDTIDVSFSGRLELIHPNISVLTSPFELTQIVKITRDD